MSACLCVCLKRSVHTYTHKHTYTHLHTQAASSELQTLVSACLCVCLKRLAHTHTITHTGSTLGSATPRERLFVRLLEEIGVQPLTVSDLHTHAKNKNAQPRSATSTSAAGLPQKLSPTVSEGLMYICRVGQNHIYRYGVFTVFYGMAHIRIPHHIYSRIQCIYVYGSGQCF